jgi:predicted nuclease of predicted toxin-antitoxin system
VTIWLDNHLSPALARWIASEFGEPCIQVRDLGLARALDREIFSAARSAARAFVTKDRDFAELVARLGPPPGIILLSCGNTSTAYIRSTLRDQLAEALSLTAASEPLVEIGRSAS